MQNKIKDLLYSLKICNDASIVDFYPRVRDREDVSVLRCNQSGVIFLSRSDHMQIDHYKNQGNFSYWGAADRQVALQATAEDDQRRSTQFKDMIIGKEWLDVGTGLGGILDLFSPIALKTLAIEPQSVPRECLKNLGYEVYSDIKDVRDQSVQVVTLFHVLEHFTEPIETLRLIRKCLKPGGKIIVEVPHAKDFLMMTLNSEAFKAFTFWSEHLILHTRRSLAVFLEEAGFRNIVIDGFQRFSLANHLYWLAQGKPGGHVAWAHLETLELKNAYDELLKNMDQTDTLIAIAEA